MKELKTILEKIEDNGFEAYIVGGYVRDKLLKLHPIDVDICTSACAKDLMWIFKSAKAVKDYGAVKLNVNKYNIDITTFRKEDKVTNGKPSKITYITSLEEDLKRRDFTINALCFNKDFDLIDKVGGLKDLRNKKIRVIGNVKEKFDEDPLRILRALRFMTILDFELDKEILNYLKLYKKSLRKINYEKRKNELDKIFSSKNIYKFISICKKYGLENELSIKFNKVVKTGYSIGIWAQIEYDENYKFTRVESSQIKQIKELVDSKKLDKMSIYKYGNYVSVVAAAILNKSTKKINSIYMNLPIKDRSDIDITSKEICEILNTGPSIKIGEVYKKLEKLILYGKIENRNEIIVNYLKKKGGMIWTK